MKIHPYSYPGINGLADPEAKKVEELVCGNLGMQPDMLQLHTRKRELVETRSLVFYILRKNNNKKWSFAKLGALYGLDHSTVIWGINLITNLMKTNKDFRARVGTFMEIE